MTLLIIFAILVVIGLLCSAFFTIFYRGKVDADVVTEEVTTEAVCATEEIVNEEPAVNDVLFYGEPTERQKEKHKRHRNRHRVSGKNRRTWHDKFDDADYQPL